MQNRNSMRNTSVSVVSPTNQPAPPPARVDSTNSLLSRSTAATQAPRRHNAAGKVVAAIAAPVSSTTTMSSSSGNTQHAAAPSSRLPIRIDIPRRSIIDGGLWDPAHAALIDEGVLASSADLRGGAGSALHASTSSPPSSPRGDLESPLNSDAQRPTPKSLRSNQDHDDGGGLAWQPSQGSLSQIPHVKSMVRPPQHQQQRSSHDEPASGRRDRGTESPRASPRAKQHTAGKAAAASSLATFSPAQSTSFAFASSSVGASSGEPSPVIVGGISPRPPASIGMSMSVSNKPQAYNNKRGAGGAGRSIRGNRSDVTAVQKLKLLYTQPVFRLMVAARAVMFVLRCMHLLARLRWRKYKHQVLMPRAAFCIQCAVRRTVSRRRMRQRKAAKTIVEFLRPRAMGTLLLRRLRILNLQSVGRGFLSRVHVTAMWNHRRLQAVHHVLRRRIWVHLAKRKLDWLRTLRGEREVFVEQTSLVLGSVLREERSAFHTIEAALHDNLQRMKRTMQEELRLLEQHSHSSKSTNVVVSRGHRSSDDIAILVDAPSGAFAAASTIGSVPPPPIQQLRIAELRNHVKSVVRAIAMVHGDLNYFPALGGGVDRSYSRRSSMVSMASFNVLEYMAAAAAASTSEATTASETQNQLLEATAPASVPPAVPTPEGSTAHEGVYTSRRPPSVDAALRTSMSTPGSEGASAETPLQTPQLTDPSCTSPPLQRILTVSNNSGLLPALHQDDDANVVSLLQQSSGTPAAVADALAMTLSPSLRYAKTHVATEAQGQDGPSIEAASADTTSSRPPVAAVDSEEPIPGQFSSFASASSLPSPRLERGDSGSASPSSMPCSTRHSSRGAGMHDILAGLGAGSTGYSDDTGSAATGNDLPFSESGMFSSVSSPAGGIGSDRPPVNRHASGGGSRSFGTSNSRKSFRKLRLEGPPDEVHVAFVQLLETTESFERKSVQAEMLQSLKQMKEHILWCVQVLHYRDRTPRHYVSLLPQLSPVWVLRLGVQLFEAETDAREVIIDEYDSTPLMFLSRPIMGVSSEKRRKRMKELLQQRAEKLFEAHVTTKSGKVSKGVSPSNSTSMSASATTAATLSRLLSPGGSMGVGGGPPTPASRFARIVLPTVSPSHLTSLAGGAVVPTPSHYGLQRDGTPAGSPFADSGRRETVVSPTASSRARHQMVVVAHLPFKSVEGCDSDSLTPMGDSGPGLGASAGHQHHPNLVALPHLVPPSGRHVSVFCGPHTGGNSSSSRGREQSVFDASGSAGTLDVSLRARLLSAGTAPTPEMRPIAALAVPSAEIDGDEAYGERLSLSNHGLEHLSHTSDEANRMPHTSRPSAAAPVVGKPQASRHRGNRFDVATAPVQSASARAAGTKLSIVTTSTAVLDAGEQQEDAADWPRRYETLHSRGSGADFIFASGGSLTKSSHSNV